MILVCALPHAQANQQPIPGHLGIYHTRLGATETAIGPDDRRNLYQLDLIHLGGKSLDQVFLGLQHQVFYSWTGESRNYRPDCPQALLYRLGGGNRDDGPRRRGCTLSSRGCFFPWGKP